MIFIFEGHQIGLDGGEIGLHADVGTGHSGLARNAGGLAAVVASADASHVVVVFVIWSFDCATELGSVS